MAAATAIRLAAEGHETTLVDLDGDLPALLGMFNSLEAAPGIGDWAAAEKQVPPTSTACARTWPRGFAW